MTEDRWLSVDEIAEYLGVVNTSIYRWIDRRGLPAHKVGKLWKLKRAEVDDWVRKGGVGTREGGASDPSTRRW